MNLIASVWVSHRAANSNLNSNSKKLDHFAELELELELGKNIFSELELELELEKNCSSSLARYLNC